MLRLVVLLGLLATGAPAAAAQQPRPQRRSERANKQVATVDLALRVETAAGAFVVFDAVTPENGEREGPAYLAYWHDARAAEVYVFDRPVRTPADVGQALRDLARDFPVDADAIIAGAEWLPDALDAGAGLPAEGAIWLVATRNSILQAMGFEPIMPQDEDLPLTMSATSNCGVCVFPYNSPQPVTQPEDTVPWDAGRIYVPSGSINPASTVDREVEVSPLDMVDRTLPAICAWPAFWCYCCISGPECCPEGVVCCNNACCNGRCCGGTCCDETESCCGSACCPTDACCYEGTCVNDGDECAQFEVCCHGTCCAENQFCCNDQCETDDLFNFCCHDTEVCFEGECCNPDGTCTLGSPLADCQAWEACQNPKSNPNHTPTSNGCSSPFGDNPTGCVDTSFTTACDQHDYCYGTCTVSKDSCDSAFYYAMLQICAGSGCQDACLGWAVTYFEGVQQFGYPPFCNAQAEACLCCDP